jgi:small multidrug resistance pump
VKYQAMFFMLLAIALELIGTTALKLSDGGARPLWYVPVAAGYMGSFYFFSLALRTLPVGIAYAAWAGVGIVGTTLIGRLVFQQTLAPIALLGIVLILLGVVLVNLVPSVIE